jgi:hypothetical protein
MMMSQYCRAIFAVAFWCVTAVIAHLVFLYAFMILIWAEVCWWNSALLIADAISRFVLLGGGTLSSLLKMKHLSAMFNTVIGAGPGPAGAF